MKTKQWLGVCSIVFAAANVPAASTNEKSSLPPYRHLSLTLEAGSTGPGASATYRFSDHFGVNAGASYLSVTLNRTIEGIPYSATYRPMSELVNLKYFPWKNKSFFISAGVFFNQNQLTGTASDVNGITLGGTTYPPGVVGTVHLSIEQQPVNPYLSVGWTWLYFDKAHHWSLGSELGVIYTGKPSVNMSRSGGIPDPSIDAALEQERKQVQHYANRFQFWPVAKITLSCSF